MEMRTWLLGITQRVLPTCSGRGGENQIPSHVGYPTAVGEAGLPKVGCICGGAMVEKTGWMTCHLNLYMVWLTLDHVRQSYAIPGLTKGLRVVGGQKGRGRREVAAREPGGKHVCFDI